MKKLKVLMLVSTLNAVDGVASYAMNYFQNLDHSKICVDFALYFDDKPVKAYKDAIHNAGGKVFVLPQFANIIEHYKKCREIIRNGNYDIIHDNSLIITYPMMLAARSVGVRILHSHNSKLGETLNKERRNKLFFPLLRRRSNTYVACSELAGKALFGDRKFTVIPNVIRSNKYQFNQEKRNMIRKQMEADGKYIIGTVGRIAEQKNPFFAVDVFMKVAEKDPNVEYWWIGSGSLENELKVYIKKLGIDNKIKLLGSREDVADLYQAIDIFFLPSFFEGLPVTGVEAQAMGLPCVISDTVTKELVYTDLVEYVSLDQSLDQWSNVLLSKKNVVRYDHSMELKQSVFSDSKAGGNLLDFYTQCLETHKKK